MIIHYHKICIPTIFSQGGGGLFCRSLHRQIFYIFEIFISGKENLKIEENRFVYFEYCMWFNLGDIDV